METVDALREARGLIENRENWIKGSFHRVIDGRDCYCADGALQAASAGDEDAWERAYDALGDSLRDWTGPISYNDHPMTTHADVLALFDRAIEAVS